MVKSREADPCPTQSSPTVGNKGNKWAFTVQLRSWGEDKTSF